MQTSCVQQLTIKSSLPRMIAASTVMICFLIVVLIAICEGFNPTLMGLCRIQRSGGIRYSKSASIKIERCSKVAMCQELESVTTTEELPSIVYSVGQEYDGIVVRAKAYAVHVNISTGANVVLPRNKHTRGKFEKLKLTSLEKPAIPIRVEITEVDAVNGTLKGIYKPLLKSNPSYVNLFDTEDIVKELHGKKLNGTIANVHASGMFVELDDFGIEGLVPSRLCADCLQTHNIKKYMPGISVGVYIEHVDASSRKLTLSMFPPGQQGTDPADTHLYRTEKALVELKRIPPQRWLQGVVQRSTAAGLHVRLANRDAIGFVPFSRIPRELVQILTQRVQDDQKPPSNRVEEPLLQPVTTESGSDSSMVDGGRDVDKAAAVPEAITGAGVVKTKKKPESGGLETLLGVGDVLKVRVQSVTAQKPAEAVDGALLLELSMLPYAVDETDGSAAGGSSAAVEHSEALPPLLTIQDRLLAATTGIPTRSHNPEDCLIWWRGASYETEAARKVRTMTAEEIREKHSQEAEDIVLESREMVAGAWRRVFERDMRQEEEEFSSKGREKEMRELQEEMAGLEGLEEEMYKLDALQTGSPDKFPLGVFVDPEMIPAEWREELTFYQELEARDKEIHRASRAGKKGEEADFQEAVRKTQLLQQQTAGGRRSGGRATGHSTSSEGGMGAGRTERRPTAGAWTSSAPSARVEGRGRPAAADGVGGSQQRTSSGPRWRTLSPEEKLEKHTFPSPSSSSSSIGSKDNAVSKSQDTDMTTSVEPSESSETTLN